MLTYDAGRESLLSRYGIPKDALRRTFPRRRRFRLTATPPRSQRHAAMSH